MMFSVGAVVKSHGKGKGGFGYTSGSTCTNYLPLYGRSSSIYTCNIGEILSVIESLILSSCPYPMII